MERGAYMKLAITIILALAIMFITPAIGELTSNYWSSQAYQLSLQGNYDMAVISYDRALELDPSNITLLKDKGLALANLGKYSEAVDSFAKATSLNSSDAQAWNLEGFTLAVNLERYDEGVACIDRALKLDSAYYDAWISKGMALANAGALDESITSFDEAMKINPLDPKGWNNKGVVLREQGKYQDALSCFNRALALNPSYEIAQNNRELTLQDINQANQDDFYELDNMLASHRQREGSNME
jgi:tetratricopeptide (TPR) repeat protein